MATTSQGAVEVDGKVSEIRGEIKTALEQVTELLNLADSVRRDLAFRIRKGESPTAEEIPALQAALTGKKALVLAAVNAIQEPSVADLTALAETPNPS